MGQRNDLYFRTFGRLLLMAVFFGVGTLACVDTEVAYTPPEDETQDPPDTTPPPREDVPEVTEIPDTCNGYAELCDRPFDEVAFPGTHNSMSNDDDGWKLPNQTYGIERQLEDGIRVFLLDVHTYKRQLYLCHSLCQLGKRELDDALWAFRDFLRTHRGEVITLIFEDHVDGELIANAMVERGLDAWVYDDFEHEEWPTLRELIDANTRLIVTAENSGGTAAEPSWFVRAWDVMFDNPWTFEEPEDFNCNANRGDRGHALALLNHWLSKSGGLGDMDRAHIGNSKEVLLKHAQDCEEEWGRIPNFIAVDHYSIGDLFEVVRILNGLAD